MEFHVNIWIALNKRFDLAATNNGTHFITLIWIRLNKLVVMLNTDIKS